MDDLTAFMRARLDEVEAAARAVQDNSDPWPGQWEADGNRALRTHNGWVLATAGTPGGEFKPGVLAHIVIHDPDRALREVAALRRLLAEIGKAEAESDAEDTIVISYYVACDLRGIIAGIWDDHPDYRPEWKPWADQEH